MNQTFLSGGVVIRERLSESRNTLVDNFVKRMESIPKIWQKFVQLEKQTFLLNDSREWKHRPSRSPSLQAKILQKLRKRKSNKSSQGRFALPLVPILQTFYVVDRICNVDSVLHYLSQLIGQFSGPYFTERAAEFKSLVELNSHKEIINMVNFCHEREITKINQ